MDDRPTKEEKLELARRGYRDKDWFGWCFWSSDPDRVINEEDIPFVVHGLRLHSGHAGKLTPATSPG